MKTAVDIFKEEFLKDPAMREEFAMRVSPDEPLAELTSILNRAVKSQIQPLAQMLGSARGWGLAVDGIPSGYNPAGNWVDQLTDGYTEPLGILSRASAKLKAI